MSINEAKKVNKNALVAQLDRALDYESRGQGFESSRAHHIQFTFGYKINLTNYIFHFVLDYQSFLFFLWAFYQLNDEFFLITRYLLNVL